MPLRLVYQSIAVLSFALMTPTSALSAAAQPLTGMVEPGPCDVVMTCGVDGDGAGVALEDFDRGGAPPPHTTSAAATPGRAKVEYAVTFACPGNVPGDGGPAADAACAYAVSGCEGLGTGPGPMTWTWRRQIPASGAGPGPWVRVSRSCAAPGPAAGPVLTLDLVRRAFREVAFARPQAHVQPEGNVTLVNLPTFYQVRWAPAGYEPGEVAELQLLGRAVRIRPVVQQYIYRFGDGERLGPTPDPGGPWPTGQVQHTYRRTGDAPVSVTAQYRGQFSIDGGPWQQVDETVTIPGPPTVVQVREARTRLQAN